MMDLVGECLKCLFQLTRGVPALVVKSQARWVRIPEVQVPIPLREWALFSLLPLALSFVFL